MKNSQAPQGITQKATDQARPASACSTRLHTSPLSCRLPAPCQTISAQHTCTWTGQSTCTALITPPTNGCSVPSFRFRRAIDSDTVCLHEEGFREEASPVPANGLRAIQTGGSGVGVGGGDPGFRRVHRGTLWL